MPLPPVMIVEDDSDLREAICVTLDLHEIPYRAFEDAEKGLMAAGQEPFSLVVSDFKLPGMDGMTLLRSLQKKAPQLPVVIMTAFAEAKLAVEALQSGARDFLIKPFQPEHLVEVIARFRPSESAVAGANGSRIIAKSAASLAVLTRCERVAATNATVLLTGESGVGKDIFARHIHTRSQRAEKPYIAINCAAIPETLLESTLFGFERGAFTGANKAQEGKFEAASGGTLFLDEIGELPIDLQAKLLRVIQDRVVERIGSNRSQEVDVRIIAATNRDLLERVSAGKFREDLYYRLAVFPVAIPPLRERMEDALPMAEMFLERFSQTMGRNGMRFSEGARAAMMGHAWPGNVRELENAVQRALLLADGSELEPGHLELAATGADGFARPFGSGSGLGSGPGSGQGFGLGAQAGADFALAKGQDSEKSLEVVEREHILRVLASCDGSRKKAIEILGISERALRYKLKDYKEQGFYLGKD
jgi:two-component system, response regulator FlrC